MSRYYTLFDSNGNPKFQTISSWTPGGGNVSSVINARRITVISNTVTHYMSFGTTGTVTATNTATRVILPANSVLDFNFVPGQYVAVRPVPYSDAGIVTIIDGD